MGDMRDPIVEMEKQIGIIGFGAVGRLLYRTLLDNHYQAEQIFIFDDNTSDIENSKCYPFSAFKGSDFRGVWFIPALGYLSGELKFRILEYLVENGCNIFSFIHPSAFVSPSAAIGRGVLVYSMSNIDNGASIGDGCIVANSTTIAHDAEIGDCVYFGANVCVCGEVRIERLSFIGSSATIANGISIGENCRIGMSSCVTKDVPDGSSGIGNPFKMKKNITLY